MEQKEIRERDLQLVQITDAAFADAAQRSGPHLVCRPGCTQCCHGAFAIHALDAWRLRQGLEELKQQDPERALAVRRRAQAYIHAFAPAFPGNPVTGILGSSEAEQEAFEAFANDAACPALDPATGLCDLYSARPMTCRLFGPPVRSVQAEEEGLAVCELCFTEASEEEILAAEMHPPRDEEQTLLELLEVSGHEDGHEAGQEPSHETNDEPGQPPGNQRDNAADAERGQETIVAWCLVDTPAD